MSINRNVVEISGRLVSDVQTRTLPSGSKVANLSVATTRFYYDKDKQKQEETTFVDCEMFGPRAEHLEQYGTKGRGIFIDGRLRQDKWQDKEGGNRQKMIVVIEDFDWTEYKEKADGDEGGQKPAQERKPEPQGQGRAANARGNTGTKGRGPNNQKDEDIPF